jgi:hypothetical protein
VKKLFKQPTINFSWLIRIGSLSWKRYSGHEYHVLLQEHQLETQAMLVATMLELLLGTQATPLANIL